MFIWVFDAFFFRRRSYEHSTTYLHKEYINDGHRINERNGENTFERMFGSKALGQ